MTDWKQKIEAQIEELRKHEEQTPLDQNEMDLIDACGKAADTLQALLDVAVAAENMTYADAVAGAETWGEMKQVLDKLREVGDD